MHCYFQRARGTGYSEQSAGGASSGQPHHPNLLKNALEICIWLYTH